MQYFFRFFCPKVRGAYYTWEYIITFFLAIFLIFGMGWPKVSYIYIVYKKYYFPDFSAQKLEVRIIHENYIITFFLAIFLIFGIRWPKVSYIYIVYKKYYFPDFSDEKLGVCFMHKNYIINFFLSSCRTIFGTGWPKVSYIKLMFCAVTEKYPLACVFVYNFVSPNVSLFLPQACCIFAWTCLCIYPKYHANFVFQKHYVNYINSYF